MDNMSAQKEWIKRTNVYEVNVRQYTQEGTFNAFANELPRLKDMGVQTLWFMPITPIAQKNKKGSMGSYYAAADYTAINPEFGTMDDFKSLVKKAQGLGFKVIIDWVANHTGWDHVWTETHPEYFEHDPNTNHFRIAYGMDDIIELDFNNAEMRKAMIEAMKFWVVETGIDGFRCDLAFWVQLDFWQQAKVELDKVKSLFWLAELDSIEHADYMQVFDAAYTWTWMHKTEEFYKQHWPVSTLDYILQVYEHKPGIKAWFTSNHDENTWNGSEYEKYGDAAKALAVFSCTWAGIPLVYSGQELPNMKRLAFFEKDPIEWNGTIALHDFYKTLLNLHATHPALGADVHASPNIRLHTSDDRGVLAYLRKNGTNEVMVVLNLSPQNRDVLVHDDSVSGTYKELFSGKERDLSGDKCFAMAAWEYLVFVK